MGVLPAPGPVDAVVGAHHRQRAGLDAVAELGQVELLQHPLAGAHIHPEAGAVDRVEREVLHAGDRVALHAAAERGAHRAHMHRILAVGLLGPAPARVAQQVHAHRPEQVGTEGAGLRAMASPMRSSRSGSQLAPRAIGTGKVVAPPSSTTPRGPSTNCRPPIPRPGSTPAGQGRRWEVSCRRCPPARPRRGCRHRAGRASPPG